MCTECAKDCQKVCKIGEVWIGFPWRLLGNDNGVIGQDRNVLLDVLAVDYSLIVERKLYLLTIFGAKNINFFPLGVVGESAGFGKNLEDGHVREQRHGTFPLRSANQV